MSLPAVGILILAAAGLVYLWPKLSAAAARGRQRPMFRVATRRAEPDTVAMFRRACDAADLMIALDLPAIAEQIAAEALPRLVAPGLVQQLRQKQLRAQSKPVPREEA